MPIRRFDFTMRLVAAFAVRAVLILSQGVLNRHIANEAEQRVLRGWYAGGVACQKPLHGARKMTIRIHAGSHEPVIVQLPRADVS